MRTKKLRDNLSCRMSQQDVYEYARSNNVRVLCEPLIREGTCWLITERSLVEYQVALSFDRIGRLESGETLILKKGAWVSGESFGKRDYCE